MMLSINGFYRKSEWDYSLIKLGGSKVDVSRLRSRFFYKDETTYDA